ncbi:MAG: AAA family ATPase [Candidatus Saccharimonadales bacterium]
MLILVTGISTSGKSTMVKELSKRGYEAHDLEHNGISAWFHKEKGTRDAEFAQVPDRSKEWADAHEWRVSMDWVNDIAKKAVDKPIFLCGGGANEKEIITFCNKVIWLKTDEETIRSRVNIPRDHTYGTKPHELIAAIEGNIQKEKEFERLGAIMIDARRSLDEVVNDVIEKIV